VQSRPLRALPPSKLWPKHWTDAWVRACKDFTGVLRSAVDDGSAIAVLQALLDFLELPTRILLPRLEQQAKRKGSRSSRNALPPGVPDPLPNDVCENPQQRAAVKRAYEDCWSKAMEALLSNGAAPNDEKTLQQMQDMHPDRPEPLRMNACSAEIDSELTSTIKAKAYLYKAAAMDRTCVDVFGWATDFLFPVRATAFLGQLARLTAKIANARVHETFAVVLTSGSLLALHKEGQTRGTETPGSATQAQAGQHRFSPTQVGLQVRAAV